MSFGRVNRWKRRVLATRPPHGRPSGMGRGIDAPDFSTLAVRHLQTTKSVSDIKSFLGLCGFYQGFVVDFATVAAHLTDLTHKSRKWSWSS